jgi:hypothetical protein
MFCLIFLLSQTVLVTELMARLCIYQKLGGIEFTRMLLFTNDISVAE